MLYQFGNQSIGRMHSSGLRKVRSEESMANLIVVSGPHAVGKMIVAECISEKGSSFA